MSNCQNCNKARATVRLTEINTEEENSEPIEMLLCEECAYESGASSQKPAEPGPASIASLAQQALSSGERQHTACDECGMGYEEFRRVGRFGCCRCYDVFEQALIPLLNKVHDATQYVGPTPGEPDRRIGGAIETERELVDLRRQLKQLVESENYEEAARVRDRIQQVEETREEPLDG